jgi:pSer/pThr/pTyr-binding forkhead associated (FHA) protein
VSRYHAVLLAGPVHTSVEDLNSTNGVFVNGKRVSRQGLKDGDRVTLGRTHFRFTVRT